MSAPSPSTIISDATLNTVTIDLEEEFAERKLYALDIEDENDTNPHDETYYSRIRRAKIYMLFNRGDSFILSTGILATTAGALGPSISSILMGRAFDVLSDFASGKYKTFGEYMHAITLSTMALLALGAGSIPVIWITISSWMQIGERQGLRAREHMLTTFLTKPISWYEENENVMGDLTQTNRCVEELRSGCAEATALFLQSIISIIALLGTSFYYSWSVTLVMISSAPLIGLLAFIFAKLTEKYNKDDSKHIKLYPKTCHGDIKFKNIDFAYPTRRDTKVLKQVNIHFPAGETTFLVGRSGSGKSTLGSLLLNFYSPNQGRVEIDGFSVQSVSPNWLTDNVTLVEQTCTLFKDTIKNNILMGRVASGVSNVSEAELNEAIQMSLLEEVIRDLEDGLETIVGPNGITLSGGQQQRVAIARARLRDTPILILDESVSALDIVMRDLVIAAVKKWRRGKTTIILTHEFSQIDDDDYVYLMEEGVVAENGFRRDLDANGVFNHLASLQATNHDDNEERAHEELVVKPVDKSFMSMIGNRMSAQIMATVNSLSYFQHNDADTEIENNMLTRPVGRRSKRSMEKTTEDDVDLEKGEAKEQNDDERPDLTPITSIVKSMLLTVDKRGTLLFGIVIALLNGALSPVFSFCASKLIAGLVPQDSDVGSASYLVKWSCIVLALAFADGASLFVKEFILDYSAELWIYGLRIKAFKKISEQGLTWFSAKTNSVSEINALILNDARDLRSLISHFLGVFSSLIVLGSMGLIWALVEGWKLSLVCISMVPLFILTSGLYAGLLQESENSYKNAVADLENELYEVVRGYKTIRTLRLESYFREKYQKRVDELMRVAKRRAIYTGMGVSITNMLTFAVQGILLYYGLKLVGKGEYTTMQLMETFVLLIFTIMNCVQLMTQVPDISRGQRAGTYTFRILDLLADEVETRGTIVPVGKTDAIVEFKGTNFCYPSLPDQRVLKDVNMKVKRGEHVAVIGESGSGKSTLTLLITRLFHMEMNSVFYEGVDVNDMDIKWLRNRVALVDQKANFFDGSIKENIAYGLASVSEGDIIDALKLANIYDFVISLPEGMHTRIDTSLVSGGQAQRLSIARALLRKPDLLILDECTSALDAESTQRISDLITHNLKDSNMSILMITHAEEMMKAADRVVVMKNGSVVEEGLFSSLYRNRGELFRIVTAGLQ